MPGTNRHITESQFWLQFNWNKAHTRYSVVFFVCLLVVAAYFSTLILDNSVSVDKALRTRVTDIPLNCSSGNQTKTCPPNYYPSVSKKFLRSSSTPKSCPHYFHWIHEDLWPWKETGITREMVERANKTANFRLVILSGRAYLETYEKGFQTRDVFTLWGFLQLLRRYPGKIPDLDLMFDCVDWPVIKASEYSEPNAPKPPPLFRYCADDQTYDIVFPDWSFWGWAEINIRPWESLQAILSEGNKRVKWIDREPYAYWRGNPEVAEKRKELMKCNVSDKQDWNARVYAQDWGRASKEESDLASQCIHRYKIYIEGSAWSVSEKYILACDSVTFIVTPKYYDFFTRSLMPMKHYWPINEGGKCRSIKFSVDWFNGHKKKAQRIGREASNFIQNELKMDFVYDYMFHLLTEYAKLLRYKPTVPQNATELCSETMACPAEGKEKEFMLESMVMSPKEAEPCSMPLPFHPTSLNQYLMKRNQSIKQVELWEQNYWNRVQKQHR